MKFHLGPSKFKFLSSNISLIANAFRIVVLASKHSTICNVVRIGVDARVLFC